MTNECKYSKVLLLLPLVCYCINGKVSG